MSKPRSSDLDHIVDGLYEATLQPELWRGLMNDMCEVLKSDSASMFSFPASPSLGAVWSEGADELVDWFLREGWHLQNPRPGRALRIRHVKPVVTESDICTPWELEHLPFNVEITHRLGYRWDMGAIINEIDGTALLLTAQRRGKRERFESRELKLLTALLPHLERATQVAARFGLSRGEGMLDALETVACAGVLLDFQGRVTRMNSRAETMMGNGINVLSRQLTAAHKGARPILDRIIGAAISAGDALGSSSIRAAALPRRSGRPLVAYAMPIVRSAQDVFPQATVMVIFIDPDEHREPSDVLLAHTFKLTAAEIKIARGLAHGHELRDIAERHRISVNTARVQLKSVMAKTETRRQSELVALLTQLSLVHVPKSEG